MSNEKNKSIPSNDGVERHGDVGGMDGFGSPKNPDKVDNPPPPPPPSPPENDGGEKK